MLLLFVFIFKEVKIIIAVKAVVNNNIASESPSVSAIETWFIDPLIQYTDVFASIKIV
jgi:hypothetical protein